ncbi:hypothetical protein KAI92_03860 [Candidatus Parcubacteria bacterium]|nr:hypothetical protein [Candidatus Parcubacteria bacterium]
MKKLILVSIVVLVGFVILLNPLTVKADWVDQTIKDASYNEDLAVMSVKNHKGNFEIAQRFVDAKQPDLAMIIWKRYIGYSYRGDPKNKARARFNIGKVRLIQGRLGWAIDDFTNAISLNNDYRGKIIEILQSRIPYYISDSISIDHVKHINCLVESINGFGGKVSNDKAYMYAMDLVQVRFDKVRKGELITHLDIALIFASTKEQKKCIGDYYLKTALKYKESSCYKKAENILGKAEINYQAGVAELELTFMNGAYDSKLTISYFTTAVGLDNSYRKKVIESLQEGLFPCISAACYCSDRDEYRFDHVKDGYIESLIDGIESFGAKANSAKNYQNAMIIANHPSANSTQLIKRLDMALLFTFTDKQRIDIGNRYLQLAGKTNDSSIYKKAENILGAKLVNQTRYGASAKK